HINRNGRRSFPIRYNQLFIEDIGIIISINLDIADDVTLIMQAHLKRIIDTDRTTPPRIYHTKNVIIIALTLNHLIVNLDGGTGGDNAIAAPSLGSDEARILDNGGQRRVGTRYNAMRMFAASDDLARIFPPHRLASQLSTPGARARRLA